MKHHKRSLVLVATLFAALSHADAVTLVLSTSDEVTVGLNGTATNPQTAQTMANALTGETLGIRERTTTGSNQQARGRLFLAFDITSIPAGATIDSASLSLTVSNKLPNSGGNNSSIDISRVTTAWDTGGTNYPLFTTAVDLTSDAGFDDDVNIGDDVSIDVKTIVDTWYATPSTNNGFRIAFAQRSFVGLAFEDDALGSPNDVPLLTIEYTPIPEPSGVALLSLGAFALASRRRR